MRAALTALLMTVVGLSAGDGEKTVRFVKSDLGKVPGGWKAEQTGTGKGSVWKVVADETAPSKGGVALAQTAEAPNAVYNICVVEDSKYKDVELKVAFKSVKGAKDQGGGFVWRYKDANNYYVARYNPLEENYRFYKVIDGKRTQLATKEEVRAGDGWHTLTVKHVGDTIECALDGKRVLDAKDESIRDAGRVGLWTKADAQTYFDELHVRDLGGKKD